MGPDVTGSSSAFRGEVPVDDHDANWRASGVGRNSNQLIKRVFRHKIVIPYGPCLIFLHSFYFTCILQYHFSRDAACFVIYLISSCLVCCLALSFPLWLLPSKRPDSGMTPQNLIIGYRFRMAGFPLVSLGWFQLATSDAIWVLISI